MRDPTVEAPFPLTAFYEILAGLPQQRGRVLLALYGFGLSGRQAAERLGISAGYLHMLRQGSLRRLWRGRGLARCAYLGCLRNARREYGGDRCYSHDRARMAAGEARRAEIARRRAARAAEREANAIRRVPDHDVTFVRQGGEDRVEFPCPRCGKGVAVRIDGPAALPPRSPSRVSRGQAPRD